MMQTTELEALRKAGTVHTFNGVFGGRPEGARGRVVMVGSPLRPNVVRVRDLSGNLHTWDRHTMSVL